MTSPEVVHNAEMAAAVARARKVETPWLQNLPDEPCLAVDATNDDACWFDSGHPGPHSWPRGR